MVITFLKKIVSGGFPTTFKFILAIVMKAYCVTVAVDIKPPYLNKRYLFRDNYYLDKFYLCFLKTKLSKFTLYKLN